MKSAAVEECLAFLEAHRLAGRGIGWNDVRLLAAARLSQVTLRTTGRRLADASRLPGVAFPHAG